MLGTTRALGFPSDRSSEEMDGSAVSMSLLSNYAQFLLQSLYIYFVHPYFSESHTLAKEVHL